MTQDGSLTGADAVWSASERAQLIRALSGSPVLEQVSASMRETLSAMAAASSVQAALSQFATGHNNKLAAIVTATAPMQRLIAQIENGPHKLFAEQNRKLLSAVILPRSVLDSLSAQSKLAELTASPAVAALARKSEAVSASVSASLFAETMRAASGISERLLAQNAVLAALPQIRLQIPVNHAARAWRLGVQGTRPQDLQPEVLLGLGRAAQAVNIAAYTVETVERPDGELWHLAPGRTDVEDHDVQQLLTWLNQVDPRLPGKLKGAWHAVHGRGPDWISQAANSGVELLDRTLRTLAPDEAVLSWREGTGLYLTELNNGRPTRALRVRYVAQSRALPAGAIEHTVKAVNSTLRQLQKIKHADDESMSEALTSALMSLEYSLTILFRGS